MGWIADSGNTEFAERLTGWLAYNSNRPGGVFADEPDIIVSGHRVLVKQRRGLDV